MKKILIYDTETTGLVPKEGSPLSAYPRLIQLGYAAYEYHEGNFRLRKEVGQLVCPVQDFEIGERAFEAHGISKEKVIAEGKATNLVLDNFLKAVEWADLLVCHNVWFDKALINSEIKRIPKDFKDPNILINKAHFCTMEFLTPITKLQPMRYGKYKWCKLEEAMQFFFGRGVEGAHDALNDVRATAQLLIEIQKRYPAKFNSLFNS